MSAIPQTGDAVFIQSDEYTGDATVTYVDLPNIYNHHFLPIQVEVDEGELHQLEEFNHGQVVIRFSLKDIMGIEQMSQLEAESLIQVEDNVQGSLFDDF